MSAVDAMSERLVREAQECELISITSTSRPCLLPAVAVRFDGLFIDVVCQEHAARAEGRGGTSVHYPAGGGAS